MKAPSPPLHRLPLAGLLPLLLSCGGSDSTGPDSDNLTQPPTVAAVAMLTSLSEQAVGSTVNVQVRVDGSNGSPMAGTAVAFAVDAGSASPTVATTNSAGVATTSWTLGSDIGSQTLTATASDRSASLTVTTRAGSAASFEKLSGDGQSGESGAALADPIVVEVTDAFGNPKEGESVTATVTSGGGSLNTTSATTDSDGEASFTWTLGTAGTNTMTVTHALGSLTFSATATSSSSGSYDIELRFIGTISASIQAAFMNAKARWEGIVTSDLPSSNLSADAGTCSENQPAVNEVVDDLIIFAEVGPIDGVGNTLGQAGPCYVRTTGNTSILGTMTFDEADLEAMEQSGTLQDVIIHEMGHVLGIGTLWEYNGLLDGKGTDNPYYNGGQGNLAYQALGGTDPNGVPVENTGEEGTRDGHWRETTFQTELMTGYIAAPGNPLSILTVLSLEDHGYTVNAAAADAYSLPSPTQARIAVTPPERRERWELLLKPRFRVSPDGARTPMR